MRFVFDADMAFESDLAQGLEYAGNIEHAFAEDDIRVLFVVVILQVDAEVPRSHDAYLRRRIKFLAKLGGAYQMPGIQTGADQCVVVFHSRHDHLGGVPAVQLASPDGAVWLNRDSALVFLTKLVDTLNAVR